MSDELVEARSSNLSAELRNPAYNDESDGHVRLRAADEIDRLTERLAGAYASVNLLTEMLEAKATPEATGIYESAWVIEGMWSSAAYPEYWVGSSAWSSDPYKALRFATKESAQQAADMMLVGINHRVACHEFAGNSHHE